MNFDSAVSLCLWAFLAFIGVTFLFQRLRWTRRGRRGKSNLGFYPSTASLGNALHQLQAIAQPQVEYVIAEKLDEEADEDDSGNPDHQIAPVLHLHRQAAKIRKGEKVDQITALLGRHK